MSQNIFHELRFKKHDEEKLFVIADRVEKGEQLFHPGDNPILAIVSEEFEKARYINAIFKQRIAERQHTRKAKHG